MQPSPVCVCLFGQIVSANPLAPLSLVREYILKRLSAEVDTIKEDERSIKQYREDTEANRRLIEKYGKGHLVG